MVQIGYLVACLDVEVVLVHHRAAFVGRCHVALNPSETDYPVEAVQPFVVAVVVLSIPSCHEVVLVAEIEVVIYAAVAKFG